MGELGYFRPQLLPPPEIIVSATLTISDLIDPTNLPSTSDGPWSKRLSDQYDIELSSDLADWFDRELWLKTGHGEFRDPVSPRQLLDDPAEVIWPGLMPCDLLPVLGNEAGDWLCVRVGADNRASEIVQWYHGGGDWLPWGNSLADALFFDALSERLPSPARRHAVPAEEPRRSNAVESDELLRWASEHVDSEVADLLKPSHSAEHVAEVMLGHRVAEVAVRCELVQSALKETLSATLDPTTAQQIGVDWNEVVQWMFDMQRMPVETRQRLQRDYGLTISVPQDWQAAERHSRAVIQLSPELAWAWDVIGYAAERNEDSKQAIDAYCRAAECSVFTDQSVRLRTYWTADHAAKFSASRLLAGYSDVVSGSEYLGMLCDEDALSRRQRITKHWQAKAEAAEQREDWSEAHRCRVASGWDLGAEPLAAFADILDHVAVAAERSGQKGRAQVALTHRRCMRERYDI